MTTMVITTRITHKYLMNKTKSELAYWLLEKMDAEELLLEENRKLKEIVFQWQNNGSLDLRATMYMNYTDDRK